MKPETERRGILRGESLNTIDPGTGSSSRNILVRNESFNKVPFGEDKVIIA